MKKWSFPNPMVILLGFILFAALLTHILPAGEYDRIADEKTGKSVVVPGSYHEVEGEPVGLFEAFVKAPQGIIDRADVIALILLIGGAFYVVDKTGAFNEGLQFLIYKFRNAREIVLILVGLAFAAGGAMENMQEEIIAMMPVILMLTNKLGYKKFVAVGISLGAAMVGAAFSPMNPFQVMIAQKIAEVPVFSGAAFRTIFLVVAVIFWLFWLIKYGRDKSLADNSIEMDKVVLQPRNWAILALLGVTFACMILGILFFDWGFNEMSAAFFIFGILAGILGKLGFNGTSRAYAEGFGEMAFAGVIVGLAGGISVALEEGRIIDTIVQGLFSPLEGLPAGVTGVGMMFAQTLLHLPVPSVSGQAALTMPLLAPLADLLQMSRQIMILAYQYGAGISDLFVPTNGGLLAVLVAAKISYNEWIRDMYKPMLIVYLIGVAGILTAIFTGI